MYFPSLTSKVMSRIKSMLLMCLIQAGTDSYKRNEILCDVLKKRHRSQLPDIHRALLESGLPYVAKLLGYEGLSGVWTLRCNIQVPALLLNCRTVVHSFIASVN